MTALSLQAGVEGHTRPDAVPDSERYYWVEIAAAYPAECPTYASACIWQPS
jgi:hypothetical protein